MIRKGLNMQVLIEVDASMPRVHDLHVELPIGNVDNISRLCMKKI